MLVQTARNDGSSVGGIEAEEDAFGSKIRSISRFQSIDRRSTAFRKRADSRSRFAILVTQRTVGRKLLAIDTLQNMALGNAIDTTN